MQIHLSTIAVFCGLTLFSIAPAMAHGTSYHHVHPAPVNSLKQSLIYPHGVPVKTGSVIYISDGSPYYGKSYKYRHKPQYKSRRGTYGAYKGYRQAEKSHAYRGSHLRNRTKKLLPSTHIYGTYPSTGSYRGGRVNPHASRWQKNHAYGQHHSYGYNPYSPRGHASYYHY